VERGEAPIVGVNVFTDGSEAPPVPAPNYSALEDEQIARLRAARASRDALRIGAALDALTAAAAAPDQPSLMPLIIEAVRARGSVGEISDRLQAAWGQFRPH
jgi:methylmalonyl-CoA mutase N-terminal domain/subunit